MYYKKIRHLDKNSPYFVCKLKLILGLLMKNYKFLLLFLSLLVLGAFVALKYIDMPAPHKVQIKILDVNDNEVK